VENARAWDQLRELHCDQAQGYHMGRPMPCDEFLAWSARWVEKRRAPGSAGVSTLLH
jgi:EAL domain-containing protein (putative c-di-GMP-specific phosphodiesterase class I)